MEKHELSKVEFQIIDKALKALQQSNLDPVTTEKVTDLRNTFQDTYTGWLEIYREAASVIRLANLKDLGRKKHEGNQS